MENGFLSEILLENGYNTYKVGKWHLTPSNEETAVAPSDRWPLGRRTRSCPGIGGAGRAALGAGAVVGNDHDQGAVQLAEGAQEVQQPAQVVIRVAEDTQRRPPSSGSGGCCSITWPAG